VFQFVSRVLREKHFLRGKTIGIDVTNLEPNGAMKTIVGKDIGEDWNDYLCELADAEGIENPTDEDLRRMDRKRKGKKMSNKDCDAPTDLDSRIAKMKDGPTHLVYKAKHAVDLETEAIGAAEARCANEEERIRSTKCLFRTRCGM